MGMNTGEKRTLESTVGDAWWEPDGLAGVPVRCDVTLREIFEWDLAEVCSFQLPRGFHALTQRLQKLQSRACEAQPI